MMKRFVPCFLAFFLCVYPGFAWLYESDAAADGYLTKGEYDGGNVTLQGFEELFVIGGGANRISARDHSYVEVQYTSTPLSFNSGIYDIMLYDDSRLLYLGGITEEITLYKNASAVLRGGRIDYITLLRRPQDFCYVTIYCLDGWQWNYVNEQKKGITGQWQDGSAFDITFINVASPFPPTADFIYVVEIPEPASLVLLAFGGLLIWHKK
jgi:hypothetical protein